MLALKIISTVLISYFLGNISSARIISKIIHQDITKIGSGNPGTMNMARNFGIKLGFLTLFCDALKGVISALIGFSIFGFGTINGYIGLYTAGISVIIGHSFPVIYKFKGGKGVACAIGVFAVSNPIVLAIVFIISAIYLYIWDYGVISSLIVITSLVVVEGIRFKGVLPISILLFCIFMLIWSVHYKNFYRLLVGRENKINFRKMLKKIDKKKIK